MDIQIIDPKEFGLEVTSVATIEQAFAPKIIERDAYAAQYEMLMTKELTPELSMQARELRLKLVKVRTGIADVHKSQKAFFLAAGKFVDAWKNKSILPVEQMEQKLEDIEKHFENIAKKKIEDTRNNRIAELTPYTTFFPLELGTMSEEVYQDYLTGVVQADKHKKEQAAAAELERIAAEQKAAEERETLRLENEKLKKEAQEREQIAQVERERIAAEKRAADNLLAIERARVAEAETKIKEAEKTITAHEEEKKVLDNSDTVTIAKSEYERLVARDAFLSCLEIAGVDNWEGYEFALENNN